LGCVNSIRRITRTVADLDRAANFYAGLGFRTIRRREVEAATFAAIGMDGAAAEEIVMRLGAEEIALARFAEPGRPYPSDSESNDLWFQHLAIVVAEMDAAFAALSSLPDWRPISVGGPQTLPPANGGVRAFKFRDPDGHPLELIWFPPGWGRPVWHSALPVRIFLGIDHSALAVSSAARSLEFYRALGFEVAARSLNEGPAQSRLDGLPNATAHITGLRPASPDGPGLELLAYAPPGRPAPGGAPNDLVTDWVTLVRSSSSGDPPRAVRDPDGHLVVIAAQ
jgi:catechol 2,3-dioxygenase-like lactoylglutathione lyase family enzyme